MLMKNVFLTCRQQVQVGADGIETEGFGLRVTPFRLRGIPFLGSAVSPYTPPHPTVILPGFRVRTESVSLPNSVISPSGWKIGGLGWGSGYFLLLRLENIFSSLGFSCPWILSFLPALPNPLVPFYCPPSPQILSPLYPLAYFMLPITAWEREEDMKTD